jgi:serine/threonine protein kinase
LLCYRCGSHVPDSAERCAACGQRQVGTARMPSTTGIRRRLSPALLAGAPYRAGDRMADRYRVKDAIGVGPLGYVFRAEDEQQGIDVAVKMIHPRFVQTAEERQLFARTLEPARKFLQPSLARVHDIGVDQGWPYVTYSFLDGLTLRRMIDSRLAKGQTFTLDEVEPFLGQMAAALEAAHPLGAHADLKPENVVILPDMLRITDWGMACGLPRLPFVQAQRQKAVHRYLAPEYVAGVEVDARADLYALGVLVGEMLTGLTPDDEIPELRLTAPELPEAVEGFYRRALNEKPEARFRSVREFYEEFLSLLGGTTERSASEPVLESAEAKVEEMLSEQEGSPEQVVPIPAAELPRFDGGAWEPARPSSREVMALEPPAWSAPATESGTTHSTGTQTESGRWQALRLWDADEHPEPGAEKSHTNGVHPHGVATPESQGSEQEANADPGSEATVSELEAAAELAQIDERLTEQADLSSPADSAASGGLGSGDAATSDAGATPADEPLLEEALGVDLVVEGDEPAAAVAAATAMMPGRSLGADTPRRKSDPLVPWLTGPRTVPVRDVPGPHQRSGESARVAPPSIAPLASVVPAQTPVAGTAVAVSPNSVAQRPPPVFSTPEPADSTASAEPARSSGIPAQARGAGSWSPAELLAQVIAEVQAEERAGGQAQPSTWEPLPLDATQPVSTDEVVARLSMEPAPQAMAGMDPTPPAFAAQALAAVAARPAVDDEDLPARRHEAGRAGRRMALLIAAGLILGMLGQYGLMKLLRPKPQPQAARISAVLRMPSPRG